MLGVAAELETLAEDVHAAARQLDTSGLAELRRKWLAEAKHCRELAAAAGNPMRRATWDAAVAAEARRFPHPAGGPVESTPVGGIGGAA